MLLTMTRRENMGTRASQGLREKGFVPGIVYGHGEDNVPVSMAAHDIQLAIGHGEQLIEADVDGTKQNFLIKDVQYDYLGQQIIHVDLRRVRLDERVEVTVPIVLRGTPIGVSQEDGVLTQHLPEIAVECLVTAIPDELRVLVSELHVDDVVRVGDLDLPDGVQAMEDPETPVASVAVVTEVEEAPAEAEAAESAEPKVIGEEPADGSASDQEAKPE